MTLSKQYGEYQITISHHSLKRIIQRNIPANNIIKVILSIIHNINQENIKLIIVNKTENYSLVIAKESNNITLITVIKTTEYRSKENELLIAV